jgi:hypothetical protein
MYANSQILRPEIPVGYCDKIITASPRFFKVEVYSEGVVYP